jgi:hypothetical protein
MKNSTDNFQPVFVDFFAQTFNLYVGAAITAAMLRKGQTLLAFEIMNHFLEPFTGRNNQKSESRKFNELKEAIGCDEF